MTPAELRAAIARLGLTQSGAARCLGVPVRTFQRWINGTTPVPELVRRVLAVATTDQDLMERLRQA